MPHSLWYVGIGGNQAIIVRIYQKVRMLSSLASYLLGSSSGAQDTRGDSGIERTGDSYPVEARLSQVEAEGDDWILIDLAVEGATALEESWYVTPPACFTRAGPVHVETSPLEDLLIEHPSMSVYRAAAPSVAPDTPPPTPDIHEEEEECEILGNTTSPLMLVAEATPVSTEWSNTRRRNGRAAEIVVDSSRRNGLHEHRNNRSLGAAEESRIVQSRSAQKVLEKRASQTLKRGRLERSNKAREVSSGKGKRPRRQDRLRLQNSGANNNRKC
ncbi:tumor protein p53-inducible nuclear protein 2 isoform X2 [Cephus cinctus]|uniref:Tumor protein p53-inducible nuclear protein 2 isoform X2 n=1 Tax=Cephus cinctus TaxID=211228 RepID=A0AAJ7BQS5_CEPCN|nr:tumor protein p53-inducible nuclear protein 2 isoform X2 [Cephus cinctus]